MSYCKDTPSIREALGCFPCPEHDQSLDFLTSHHFSSGFGVAEHNVVLPKCIPPPQRNQSSVRLPSHHLMSGLGIGEPPGLQKPAEGNRGLCVKSILERKAFGPGGQADFHHDLINLIALAVAEHQRSSGTNAAVAPLSPLHVPEHSSTSKESSSSNSSNPAAALQSTEQEPALQGSNMIFLNKLPRCADEMGVRAAFERFGMVKDAKILRDDAGISRCCGFVHFHRVHEASAALCCCQQGKFQLEDEKGKKWYVKAEYAKSKPTATSRGGHRSKKKHVEHL